MIEKGSIPADFSLLARDIHSADSTWPGVSVNWGLRHSHLLVIGQQCAAHIRLLQIIELHSNISTALPSNSTDRDSIFPKLSSYCHISRPRNKFCLLCYGNLVHNRHVIGQSSSVLIHCWRPEELLLSSSTTASLAFETHYSAIPT